MIVHSAHHVIKEIGYHLQEDLAKSGFKPDMKYKSWINFLNVC